MIKLKLLLEGKYKYGCLMAILNQDISKKIIDFNYSLIKDKDLFEDGDDKGRECHPHSTVKYGLTKSYSEDKMKEMLKSVHPFKIKIKGISVFENDDFDVVKLDIESKEMNNLHEKFSKLPNEDEYPEYHPHITLAYVKKGTGKKFAKSCKKFGTITVSTLEYSDKGEKTYYNL